MPRQRVELMTQNKWLVVFTALAIAVGGFAGVAAQSQRAHAAALSAAAKHAHRHQTLPSRTITTTKVVSIGGTTTPTATATAAAATTATKSSTEAIKTTAAKKTTPGQSGTTTTAPVPVRAAAVGDLVRYGAFNNAPLYWRILSLDGKRVVLLSDEVVTAGPYQRNEDLDGASDYSASSVRSWLNTTFVPSAFGANAAQDPVLGRSSASDAIAGDIAYLLTPSQVRRYLPEADDRIGNSSLWAQANAGYGDVELAPGPVYWWLAPDQGADSTNVVPVVQTSGGINERRYAAIASDGVRPAIKLNATVLKLAAIQGSPGIYSVGPK